MWLLLVGLTAAGCGRVDFDARHDAGRGAEASTADAPGLARSLLVIAPAAESLEDVVVPVFLDASRADMGLLGDGSTLRFYDEDGTVMPHELEASGAGQIVAWLRVTGLTAPRHVLAAYGDAAAPASTGAVWGAPYASVLHMGAAMDVEGRALTTIGTTVDTGIAGNARRFVEVNRDYARLGDDAAFDFSQLTISGWINMDSMPQIVTALITRELGTSPDNDIHLGVDNTRLSITMTVGGTTYSNQTPPMSIGAWHYLALTHADAMMTGYLDGAPVSGQPTNVGAIAHSPNPFLIGADRNNIDSLAQSGVADVDYANGRIDEVRIETVARKAAYIAYQYEAVRDQVITYGAVEH